MLENIRFLSPACSRSAETIKADERKLKQVLYSLLSNAIKFTPDGGSVALTAQMHAESHPVVEICVQDTGIGMEQAEIQRIFRPFEQQTSLNAQI